MISIIVDNYNRSYLLPFLMKTYDSYNFTLDEMEMIIVDDFSQDHFEEFVKLGIDDVQPRFKVRAFKTNKVVTYNPALPLNIGVKQSKGDLLILNHSDVFPLGFATLHRLWRRHQKVPNLVLVPKFMISVRGNKDKLFMVEFGSPLPNGLSLPKRFFEEVCGFDESFYGGPSVDTDFIFRLRTKFSYEWNKEIVFAHIGAKIAKVRERMQDAPWKPGLGIRKEDFNRDALCNYNNNLCAENHSKGIICANPNGWGELDTLTEIKL